MSSLVLLTLLTVALDVFPFSSAPKVDCRDAIRRIVVDRGWNNDLPPQQIDLHLLEVKKSEGKEWLEFAQVTRTYSRYGFFTERIERKRVEKSESDLKVLATPKPLGKVWHWNLVQPHLHLIRQEYLRRKWPASFSDKLDANSLAYLDESTYITVYDTETGRVMGGFRVIQTPIAKKLPIESYLDIDIPHELGIKSEIGALAVDHQLDYQMRMIVLSELWVQLHSFSQAYYDKNLSLFGQSFYAYADKLGLKLYLPLGLRPIAHFFRGSKISEEAIKRDGIYWTPLEFTPMMMDGYNSQFSGSRGVSSQVLTDLRLEGFRDGQMGVNLEPLERLIELYDQRKGVERWRVLWAITSRLEMLAKNYRVIELRPYSLAARSAKEVVKRLEFESAQIERFLLREIESGEINDRHELAKLLKYAALTANNRKSITKEFVLRRGLLPLIIKGDEWGHYEAGDALRSGFSRSEILSILSKDSRGDLDALVVDINDRLKDHGYRDEEYDNFQNAFLALWDSRSDDDYLDAFMLQSQMNIIRDLAKGSLENLRDLMLLAAIKSQSFQP